MYERLASVDTNTEIAMAQPANIRFDWRAIRYWRQVSGTQSVPRASRKATMLALLIWSAMFAAMGIYGLMSADHTQCARADLYCMDNGGK